MHHITLESTEISPWNFANTLRMDHGWGSLSFYDEHMATVKGTKRRRSVCPGAVPGVGIL